jgi:hypothetical protein
VDFYTVSPIPCNSPFSVDKTYHERKTVPRSILLFVAAVLILIGVRSRPHSEYAVLLINK